MLEHLPGWLGGMLRNVRAGHSKLVIVQPELDIGDAVIEMSSPAFAYGARLPTRFTADGEGVSPPLLWGEAPAGTASLALIVEDPDAPALQPLVHALIWNLPPDERSLAEGAIVRDGPGGDDGRDVGRNSFFAEGWLPPDPPTGHGAHDYVFQLFALSEALDIGPNPGRSGLVKALTGRVLGAGMLVGTYSRGEEATLGGQRIVGVAPA
ncbi:phosphatidylethanolamine-binding protein [Sphingomonas sp. Root710]|uniref:YbhB/YbcL family Raf kinase inhibitor-like protein n=1 Tax=Sphingomonas sp. Root710 TaxID=1736594 RepID=UPI000701F7F4|nr:YbhB/YbcL family Raf kinase inhibitor-like protein [Sphingomonas sp. Root710]KRB86365.1 phosphatidylethanolamine-binding protein [Sphingomonas sp. Root710]